MDSGFRCLGFNPMHCGQATARLLRLSVGRDEGVAMPLLATQVVKMILKIDDVMGGQAGY